MFKVQRWLGWAVGMLVALIAAGQAQALPSFARQTGQQCSACHAGGQFPELTPFGRMFKLTGYTIGGKTVPLSAMVVASMSSIANPPAGTAKNGSPILATGSVFLAGKITDHLGGFAQITYDPYAVDNGNGTFSGHSNADNMDLRFARSLTLGSSSWIVGASLNNNPSIADPWNSAPAWMQYVPVPSPSSSQFVDGASPYPGYGAGGNIAGLSAYAMWEQTVYAELGLYRSANKLLSFMRAGVNPADRTELQGSNNPYWRLALTREWGSHNLMVGASGMQAKVFDQGSNLQDPMNLGQFRNLGVDAQYQYLGDPHTVTAQLAHMRQTQLYSENAGGVAGMSDTTRVTRAKLSYVYQSKVGGSLSAFHLTGTTNLQSDPATRGISYEAFWLPIQNLRLGVQYTAYSQFAGAHDNYDGAGRHARDNNTVFVYGWTAF